MSNMALLIHTHLLITQLVSELLTHTSVKNKFTSWRTVFVDSSFVFSFRYAVNMLRPSYKLLDFCYISLSSAYVSHLTCPLHFCVKPLSASLLERL